MKRLSKAILIGASALVVLSTGLVFGLNWYVQKPETRARIQQQMSEALGMPLEITQLKVGFTGVHVGGVRIPSGESSLLEADAFSAEYKLLPLLRHQVVIRRMTLEHPRVKWAQNAEGKWVLPLLPEKGERDKLPNAQGPKQKSSEPKNGGFEIVLGRLEIVNGTIELLDESGQRVGLASEVQMEYTIGAPDTAMGSFSAKRLAWINYPAVSEVQSSLKYDHGVLTLPDLHGTVAGGDVQGSATVQTGETDAPFSIQLRLEKVDLGRLTTEVGWQPEQAAGTLGGTVEWHGAFRDLDHAEAKGHVTLTEGRFQQLDLFETIGQILQIPELEDLHAESGSADFHFANEKTTIDQLTIETGDLQFETKGTVKSDGKMALTAQLSVSDKLAKQLPSFVRSNFSGADGASRSSIAFDITGHTDKPKTNLLNRIVGQQVNGQMNNLLSSVFGGDKKDDKDKDKDKDKEKDKKKEKKEKRKAEEAAAAAAAAAAGGGTPPAPAPEPPAKTPPAPAPAPEPAATTAPEKAPSGTAPETP